MSEVERKLQEVICALDSVLKGEGWIFSNRMIAKRAERETSLGYYVRQRK